MATILVTGALGQLGSELTWALRNKWGEDKVIATDVRQSAADSGNSVYEKLDVMDHQRLHELVRKYNVTQIYHLAAILSAKGEKEPLKAWDLNMTSLLNVLNCARNEGVKKVFWPSSIAVFGPNTPSKNVPQQTIMDPNTVYGISKLAGERWCNYYFTKYGVDVRSIRYPGLISYKAKPGGGTTDYAVDMFFQALRTGSYECFLRADTLLPMMYIDDAVRGTLQLMDAPSESITVRAGYNLGAMSFSPEDLAEKIMEKLDQFHVSFSPDFRQEIADSWPDSVDDRQARNDWHWEPAFDLNALVTQMLKGIQLTLPTKHQS